MCPLKPCGHPIAQALLLSRASPLSIPRHLAHVPPASSFLPQCLCTCFSLLQGVHRTVSCYTAVCSQLFPRSVCLSSLSLWVPRATSAVDKRVCVCVCVQMAVPVSGLTHTLSQAMLPTSVHQIPRCIHPQLTATERPQIAAPIPCHPQNVCKGPTNPLLCC